MFHLGNNLIVVNDVGIGNNLHVLQNAKIGNDLEIDDIVLSKTIVICPNRTTKTCNVFASISWQEIY